MGKLATTAFTPVAILWALAESRIWLSMVAVAVLAAAFWILGIGAAMIAALFVLAVLLMRADPVLEQQAAAAKA